MLLIGEGWVDDWEDFDLVSDDDDVENRMKHWT